METLLERKADAMTELDFSGKQQLYYQLYDILFQDIVNGVYAVGDLIPSESELMRQYGVSRATARKAMEMLANNGLIQKRRGYGSEVVSNRPNTSPQRVASYIKRSLSDKTVPEKRLIDAGVVPADDEAAGVLGVAPGAELYRLRRVRYSGDTPFYFEVNYFENGYLPDPLEHDFSKEALRVYISNECHIIWRRAEQCIYAVAAPAEIAGLLGIKTGDPLLYIRRISFDAGNVARELVKTYYRADLYHLEVELDA